MTGWLEISKDILDSNFSITRLAGKYEDLIPGLIERQAEIIAWKSQNEGIGSFALLSFAIFANNIGNDPAVKKCYQTLINSGILSVNLNQQRKDLFIDTNLRGHKYKRFELSRSDILIPQTPMNIINEALKPIHNVLLSERHPDRKALVQPNEDWQIEFAPNHIIDPLFILANESKYT